MRPTAAIKSLMKGCIVIWCFSVFILLHLLHSDRLSNQSARDEKSEKITADIAFASHHDKVDVVAANKHDVDAANKHDVVASNKHDDVAANKHQDKAVKNEDTHVRIIIQTAKPKPDDAPGVPDNPIQDRKERERLKWMDKRKSDLFGEHAMVQYRGPISYNYNSGTVFLPQRFVRRRRPSDEAYQISVLTDDTTALDRKIPDARTQECKERDYGDTSGWPTTTVVIPFHNEVLSSLIRTCYSILNQTAEHLLEEIILVDDASTNPDMHSVLEDLLAELKIPKLTLLRLTERQGLMRTRQAGADLAKGDIIVFEDSHCENNEGWLEPIVKHFLDNPKTLIQPRVRSIDNTTIEATPIGVKNSRTTFGWNIRMIWMEPHPDDEPESSDAYVVPSLVGCVFAVGREFFKEIGGFDLDFDLWGSENHEVPFRFWQCGGQVLTDPCSQVAHTFRPHSYHLDMVNKEFQRNAARSAELWFGKYLPFYYATNRGEYPLNDADMKNIEERKNFIFNELKCDANFDHLIEKAFSDIPKPPLDGVVHGNMVKYDSYRGVTVGCGSLDEIDNTFKLAKNCHPKRLLFAHFWTLTTTSLLRWEASGECLAIDQFDSVITVDCEDAVEKFGSWQFVKTKGGTQTYEFGMIQYKSVSNPDELLCLGAVDEEEEQDLFMQQQQQQQRRRGRGPGFAMEAFGRQGRRRRTKPPVYTIRVEVCTEFDTNKIDTRRRPAPSNLAWAWTYYLQWDKLHDRERKMLSQFSL